MMGLYDPGEFPSEAIVSPDFTVADVLAWARTKPANGRYEYDNPGNCALCFFLRETMRAATPEVSPHLGSQWSGFWDDGDSERHPYPAELEPALSGNDTYSGWTFGGLVKRLEALA